MLNCIICYYTIPRDIVNCIIDYMNKSFGLRKNQPAANRKAKKFLGLKIILPTPRQRKILEYTFSKILSI